MGIVAVGITISALTLVIYEHQQELITLRDQLQKRGIAFSTGLASQSSNLILTDNQFALYSLVKDIGEADKDFAYAFILDASGEIIVHTFTEGFPVDLKGKNQVLAGEQYSILRLQTENGTIQDIAVPILDGKVGVVHLGMSENTINTIVASHTERIMLLLALVLALGLTLTYGLASILTKPISRLAQAAHAVSQGNFIKWETPFWARDEIGALGNAFNHMSEELKRKEDIREQLLAKIISAQEDERKRIARELHDETGQALTTMMVDLKCIEDSCKDSQIIERIGELRALTAQTLDEVHHLASALRPSLLDDHGLVAALQKHIRDYSTKMNINIDSQINLYGEYLSPDIETTVFRIIQEALTNIAKYAESKNVSIIVGYRDSSLIAIIEDDGTGFDVDRIMSSPNDKNLGLLGMSERALLIGGKIVIESEPGAGTTIFLEVPLKSSEGARWGK